MDVMKEIGSAKTALEDLIVSVDDVEARDINARRKAMLQAETRLDETLLLGQKLEVNLKQEKSKYTDAERADYYHDR